MWPSSANRATRRPIVWLGGCVFVIAVLAACTAANLPAPTPTLNMAVTPPATAETAKAEAMPSTSTRQPAPTPTSAASEVSPVAPSTATRAAPFESPTLSPPTVAPPSATNTAVPPTVTSPTMAAPAAATTRPAILVDHRSVDDFDRIPEEYLQAAATIAMMFMDRSVGQNISEGLDCLSAPSTSEARNFCRVSKHFDPAFSVDPAVLEWSRPGGYDRSNWVFIPYPEGCSSNWSAESGCFMDAVKQAADTYQAVGYQFTYFDVRQGSSIADQPGGFFTDSPKTFDVYDLAAFESAHPELTFILWTSSLARGIGSPEATAFNEQMRQYAATNGKILFDAADILSHDPSGNPCYDNRDGVPYSNRAKSEDYPDDGQALPAICPHYTTEIDGGHLGSVSAGKIRLAKAMWVLMARLAGWAG